MRLRRVHARLRHADAAPHPGHMPARSNRPAYRRVARAFVMACALTPVAGHAQSVKLEAAYVVLGPQGAVARAVIADATRCPAIAVDGSEQAMNVRALPDAAFPALVCELPLAAGTKSASIENLPLPVLKPTLTSIAAFGDTGCRLKAGKRSAKADADQEEQGKFQDCNIPARWPFASLAASVAAAKPDLESGFLRPRRAGAARGALDHGARQSRNLQPRRRGLFPPARPDARENGAAVHRSDSTLHHHGGGPIVHRPRFEQSGRYLPVRQRPLCRGIHGHAAGAWQLAPHRPAGVGLPFAPQDHQRHLAAGAGGL